MGNVMAILFFSFLSFIGFCDSVTMGAGVVCLGVCANIRVCEFVIENREYDRNEHEIDKFPAPHKIFPLESFSRIYIGICLYTQL